MLKRLLLVLSLSLWSCQPVDLPDPQPSETFSEPSASPTVVPTEQPSPTPQLSNTPSSESSLEPEPSETPFPLPTLSPHPVEVVAGSGEKGQKDGPALQASFIGPGNLCSDPTDGSIYILDVNKVRKLTPDGQVITVAGQDQSGFQDGAVKEALFSGVIDCAVAADGTVYILDYNNQRVRVIHNNQVKTLLGNGTQENAVSLDGPMSQARLYYPTNILLAPNGDLYIAENFRLRYWNQKTLTTLNKHQKYDTSSAGTYTDGPISNKATFNKISDMAMSNQGELFIADWNHGLRHINIHLEVNTIDTFNTVYSQMAAKVASNNSRYYSTTLSQILIHPDTQELYGGNGTVYKIFSDGNVVLIAGQFSFSQSTPFSDSSTPKRMTIGKDGHIYIIDYGVHQIKRVLLPKNNK